MNDELLQLLHETHARHQRDPNDVVIIREMCELHIAIGREDSMLPWVDRALALRPHDPVFVQWRRSALTLVGAHADAVSLLLSEQALPWLPAHFEFHLGYSLMMTGNLAEAIPLLETARHIALEHCPQMLPDITQVYGEALLRNGDNAGFGYWISRNDAPGNCGSYKPEGIALWAEGSDVRGKRVLITHQLGFGDQFLLSACVADWQAAGASVMLTCDPHIQKLLEASLPGSHVVGAPRPLRMGEPLPEAVRAAIDAFAPDLHLSLLHAPMLAHRPGTPTRPFRPYLRPPAQKQAIAEEWSHDLRARHPGKRLVGLFWDCGNRHDPRVGIGMRCWAERRTFPLKMIDSIVLDPTIAKDVHFVDLHHPLLTSQAGTPAGNVSRFDPGIYHFDDTAALISQLDAVIAVDSSVSNLAAMMNKPTCVPVNAQGDWRWGITGTTSPWIDNAVVFRQRKEGDWSPVLTDIKAWLTLT